MSTPFACLRFAHTATNKALNGKTSVTGSNSFLLNPIIYHPQDPQNRMALLSQFVDKLLRPPKEKMAHFIEPQLLDHAGKDGYGFDSP
ncbi:MAG: hypothetical protein HW408_701 [Actinobacteria bacterium]|nr:hypothetical protein [Actinomycetota bacterium]